MIVLFKSAGDYRGLNNFESSNLELFSLRFVGEGFRVPSCGGIFIAGFGLFQVFKLGP